MPLGKVLTMRYCLY